MRSFNIVIIRINVRYNCFLIDLFIVAINDFIFIRIVIDLFYLL